MKHVRIEGGVKLSSFIKPMMAQLSDRNAFNDPNWLFEIKWDGYRAIAEVKKEEIRFYSRNGLSFVKAYPKIYNELKIIPPDTVIDGEIVVFDSHGRPSFQHLQNYSSRQKLKIQFYVFDCLEYKGKNITGLPLLERKKILQDFLPTSDFIKYCDHIEEQGEALYNQIVKANFEGIIAKRSNSVYLKGKRTSDWLKIKHVNSEEAVIVGYTDPKASRKGFGSLVLATHQDGKLIHIGNVGTGFTEQSLHDLSLKLLAIERKKSPLDVPIADTADIHWVDPIYVCNIKFTEKTEEGTRRHPVFLGLRIDKEINEVKPEGSKQPKERYSSTSTDKNTTVLTIEGNSLTVKNIDKVYWPKKGITKKDVINYYSSIAKYILPHLKDRPQTLFRNAGGIGEEGFYHKNAGNMAPSFVSTAKIASETYGEDRHWIICNNASSLIYLNTLGCIEINPWLSKVQQVDYPDYVVMDLDPSQDNTFEQVIEVALCIKDILDKAGAKAYCKTSGSSGLHIYIPINGEFEYEPARSFANIIALLTNQQLPSTTTLTRSLEKRKKNKIYVDYLQNRRGATLASVYSVRPVEDATVSMPLHWKEVKSGLSPKQFTIQNALARIEKQGDIFAPVLKETNDIQKCLKKLGI